jgi:hypothetical protein
VQDVKQLLECQQESYSEQKLAGIPIIEILNFDTMMKDGYVAVPFLPEAFVLDTPEKREAIRKILESSYIYDVITDAHHGTKAAGYKDTNFRADPESGLPILADFMEESEESLPKDLSSRFALSLTKILRSWTRDNPKDPLLNQLDPRILNLQDIHTAKGNFANLTVSNIMQLFQEIAALKKKRNPLFLQEVLRIVERLGLSGFSLSALKSLLVLKRELQASGLKLDEPISFKVRSAEGVWTVGEFLETHTVAELIQKVGNGNPAITALLTP